MRMRPTFGIGYSAGLVLALLAGTAHAQEAIDPEIERLVEVGLEPRSALAEAARQQGEGDLLGAAATLERALIESPGADAVRIEYVAVLCKLDDRDSARFELDLLQGRAVGSQGWNRMVAACGADFAGGQRRVGEFNARLSAGLAFDSNAAEQLTSFEVFGNDSKSGLAFVASAQVDAKIGAGAGYIYGNLFALTHNDLAGAANEYQFGQAEIGYGKEFGGTAISGGAVVRHGRLFGSNHVTAYGGQARIATRLGSAAQLVAAAEVVHEDYATDVFDGTHYDVMVGYDLTTTKLERFFVGLGAERKTTGVNFADFTAYRLAGSVELPLGSRGAYVSSSVTVRRIVFDAEPGSGRLKQWRMFSRLAVGIPVIDHRLFIEPSINCRLRGYNASQFVPDYGSVGGELRLVWNF